MVETMGMNNVVNKRTILHLCNDFLGSRVYRELYRELSQVDNNEQAVYVPIRKSTKQKKEIIKKEKFPYKVVFSPTIKKYHRIFFRKKINFLYRNIVEKIDVGVIDMVYATTLFSDGAVAYKLNRNYQIPYIIAVRNTDVNLFLKYRPDLIPKGIKVMENASRIIFISEGLKQKFYSHFLIKKYSTCLLKKTMVISNGIEQFWLKNKRLENSVTNNKFLFVGRFDSNKNVINLIKALDNLRKEYCDITLDLVGGGGNKEEEILDIIQDNQSWINYHGYVYERNKLLRIYRQNKFFAMPSIYETFGLVYVEALSQGLPVLYTKGQGIDGIFNGDIGYATNPDVASIEENIGKMINQSSYDLTKIDFNQYNWNYIALRYKELFEEVLKG